MLQQDSLLKPEDERELSSNESEFSSEEILYTVESNQSIPQLPQASTPPISGPSLFTPSWTPDKSTAQTSTETTPLLPTPPAQASSPYQQPAQIQQPAQTNAQVEPAQPAEQTHCGGLSNNQCACLACMAITVGGAALSYLLGVGFGAGWVSTSMGWHHAVPTSAYFNPAYWAAKGSCCEQAINFGFFGGGSAASAGCGLLSVGAIKSRASQQRNADADTQQSDAPNPNNPRLN